MPFNDLLKIFHGMGIRVEQHVLRNSFQTFSSSKTTSAEAVTASINANSYTNFCFVL